MMKSRGEHGPPLWRQEIDLDIAGRLGIVSDEKSEREWLDRVRKFGNQKDWDRWNARSRRFWWELDAYFAYVGILKGERLDGWLSIPPEIDAEGQAVPPKVAKFDAENVANWAHRHRRQKVSYPDLAKELGRKRRHQIGGLTRRLRSERLVGSALGEVVELRQRLIDRKPPSARSIRRQVDENAHVWELAEAELAR